MKKQVIHYKKCLICGKIQAYVMRADNTNTSIKDENVMELIYDAIRDGFSLEWCENCNIMTKQEEVGWDYIDGNLETIPEDLWREGE